MKNLSTPRFSFLILILIFILTGLLLANLSLAEEKIDINSASQKELEKIIGIGPVLAQRIIKARPFCSLEELIKVKGIGPKTLEKIKNQGLAYVEIEKTENKPQTQDKVKTQDITESQIQGPILDKKQTQIPIQAQIIDTDSVLLIALAFAIFSGTIILALKNQLKNI